MFGRVANTRLTFTSPLSRKEKKNIKSAAANPPKLGSSVNVFGGNSKVVHLTIESGKVCRVYAQGYLIK